MKERRRTSIHACNCVTCRAHPYSASAEEHRAINRVLATLDERHRRQFVGLLALQWGRGGVQQLVGITGLSRNTIGRGRDELLHPPRRPRSGRIRRPGGGRLRVEKNTRRC